MEPKKSSRHHTHTTQATTSRPKVVSTPSVIQTPTATSGVTPTLPLTGTPSVVLTSPSVVSAMTSSSAATTPAPTTTTATAPSTPDAPPDVTFPAIPASYTVGNKQAFLGYYVNQTELAAAPGVVKDLTTFAGYTTLFGASIPDAPAIAGAVTAGINWRILRNACEEFTSYVKTQDAIAWKAAILLLDELKPAFLAAATKNTTLATAYPGLAAMFDATTVIARSGTNTKRRKAKAKKATAAKAAAAASTAEGSTATPPTAAAPAATPKPVTVNA